MIMACSPVPRFCAMHSVSPFVASFPWHSRACLRLRPPVLRAARLACLPCSPPPVLCSALLSADVLFLSARTARQPPIQSAWRILLSCRCPPTYFLRGPRQPLIPCAHVGRAVAGAGARSKACPGRLSAAAALCAYHHLKSRPACANCPQASMRGAQWRRARSRSPTATAEQSCL